MDSFTLGQAPHRMTTVLSPGTDFVAVLTRSDGNDWPPGTTVQLQIDGNTPLDATVNGPNVVFEVPDTTVDYLIGQNPVKARLYYANAGTRVLWATGPVVIR